MPTDHLNLDTEIGGMLHRRPAVGLAVGVVRNGCLEATARHLLTHTAGIPEGDHGR